MGPVWSASADGVRLFAPRLRRETESAFEVSGKMLGRAEAEIKGDPGNGISCVGESAFGLFQPAGELEVIGRQTGHLFELRYEQRG